MRYFYLGFLEKCYIQGHKNQNIFMIKTNNMIFYVCFLWSKL